MEQEVVLDVKVKNQTLKQQLREAVKEAQSLQEQFGATSQQAINAAKKVANIKEEISDMNDVFKAFNPESKFNAVIGVTQGIAGGFQALTGAMALFGTESEAVEKTLLKVQAASALAEGLNSIKGLGVAFNKFKLVAVDAFKAIKVAIGTTGIGLLVVALGTLVAYWDDIKEAVSGVSEEQKKLLKDQEKGTKESADKLDFLEKQDNILKEQGKTEKEILQMKVVATDEAIKAMEAQLLTQEQIKKSQVETAERNKVILQNIIRLIALPLTQLLAGIDLAGKAFGKNFGLEEKFSGGLAKMMFDPAAIKEEADKGIKETQNKLNELKNKRAGFNLSIKQIDDEARQKDKDAAKKHSEELLKEQEEFNNKRLALLSDLITDEEEKLYAQQDKELQDIQKQYAKKDAQRKELETLLSEKYKILFAELKEKERLQAEEEAAKDREQQRKDFEEGIAMEMTMLDVKLTNMKTNGELTTQAEIDIENQRFELLKELNKNNWVETQKLTADHNAKIKELNDKATNDAIEAKKAERDAIIQLAQQTLNGLTAIAEMGIKNEKKLEQFRKAAALVQIGIDTAMAISSGVANASKYAKNPLMLALSIATTIATVLTNMAKARQILQSAGNGASAPTLSSAAPAATSSANDTAGGVTGMQAPQQVGQGIANANAINNALNNPNMIRAVVVETDITDSQRRVRGIEERATFG